MSRSHIRSPFEVEDIMDEDSEDSFTNSMADEVAAHPLNSLNPPPVELADHLDNLVNSHTNLLDSYEVITLWTRRLIGRLQFLNNQIDTVLADNPQFQSAFSDSQRRRTTSHTQRSHNEYPTITSQTFARKSFEAKEHLLRRYVMQVNFLRVKLVRVLEPRALQLETSFRDMFDEFLGNKHPHPPSATISDITRTDAEITRTCFIPGCNWYANNGPFEYEKRPYSQYWWSLMNHTEFDWAKVGTHSRTLQTATQKLITEIGDLIGRCELNIPSWFWVDFTLKTVYMPIDEVETVVSFRRTPEMMKEDLKKMQVVEGSIDADVLIDAEGEETVNISRGLDCEERKLTKAPDGKLNVVTSGSWLNKLGFYDYYKPRIEAARAKKDAEKVKQEIGSA